MAESLSTLAGEPVETDTSEAAFAAAMAAPAADRPGLAAPARRPPEPAPDPENAPHGWTFAEGEWRPKKTAGRPRTAAEKPRVTDAPAAPATKPAAAPTAVAAPATKADYRQALRETAEAAWFVLATTPVPEQAFGFKLGRFRTQLRVQAYLIEQNADGLANGINTVGQHNRFVGQALARLAAGEAGLWVLPAVMMLAPFAAGTAQLWSGKLAGQAELDDLAGKVEEQATQYLANLAASAAA